jgi:hypothetical protein
MRPDGLRSGRRGRHARAAAGAGAERRKGSRGRGEERGSARCGIRPAGRARTAQSLAKRARPCWSTHPELLVVQEGALVADDERRLNLLQQLDFLRADPRNTRAPSSKGPPGVTRHVIAAAGEPRARAPERGSRFHCLPGEVPAVRRGWARRGEPREARACTH